MNAEIKKSAGGVVIHPDLKRVLLRKPAQNPGYDDLQWTHAKGGLDGQSTLNAAIREVSEELGVKVKVVSEIPGWFGGTTTMNKYYVMIWAGDIGGYDSETEEVRWFTWDDAVEAMLEGDNISAINRDIKVLNIAKAIIKDLG